MNDAHDDRCVDIERIFDPQIVDPQIVDRAARDAHVRNCVACADRLAAAERHVELLRRLERPISPAALRSRAFLDSIYERAADSAAAALGDDVRAALATRFVVPSAGDAVRVDFEHLAEHVLSRVLATDEQGPSLHRSPAATFDQLEQVPAPAMLWPRVRSELETWSEARRDARKARFKRRLVSIAAAAVVLTGVWLGIRRLDERPVATPDMQAASATRDQKPNDADGAGATRDPASAARDVVVIVRHRVSAPLAGAFSLGEIAKQTGVPLGTNASDGPDESLLRDALRGGGR